MLSYLKRAAFVFLVFLFLAPPGYADEERDITLQWDESIDAPYLQSYKVYYYTIPGDPNSLTDTDYAASYTLADGVPIPLNPLTDPRVITIDKSNTQITLHFLESSKIYFFAVTAVDTRGLESLPTPALICMTLMVSKAGTKAGAITSSPSAIHCTPTTCSANYSSVTEVTLSAVPDAGNGFTGWSGGGCSGTGSCVVNMISCVGVTATFLPLLDVVKTGEGTGTVTGSPSGAVSDINCGTDCASAFNIGTAVTLTAAPDAGNVFTGWSGECSGTELTCNVTMDTGKSVSAAFMPLRRLTVAKAGTGRGLVTGSPLGINTDINCGTACATDSADYIINTVVTLTATPNAGNDFTGWSGGGCSGTELTCNVTMDAIKNVTATFTPNRTLTVVKEGTGTGTVTGLPLGISSDINCGTDCTSDSADYLPNTVVTLTAAADPDNIFIGWFGGVCSGTQPCTVTMSAAKSVTATFMPIRTLAVAKEGTGTGTVTASPSGISSDINCGTACASDSADYIDGTTVTLTAAPDADRVFLGWSGGGCSGTGSCFVAMNAAQSVVAAFVVKGDINLDGVLDLTDLILVFQVICRVQPAGIHRTADANNDARLGLADAIFILQKTAGLR